MKNTIITFIIINFLLHPLSCKTNKMIFSREKSPYLIEEDLIIARDCEMIVEPGVSLKFTGCGLYVYGSVSFIGTENQNIEIILDDNSSWNGINIDGYSVNKDSTVFRYCVFKNLVNSDSSMANIVLQNDAKAVFNSCNFENNSGNNSGVFLLEYSQLSFKDCVFKENRGAFDGGVINAKHSSLELTDCDFINNRCAISGGAIRIFCSNLYLSSSTFIDNSAYEGGSLYLDSSEAEIVNSLFFGSSSYSGGVIYSKSTSLEIYNSTLRNNYSESNSNSFFLIDSNFTMVNSIIWNDEQVNRHFFFSDQQLNSDCYIYYCLIQNGLDSFGGCQNVVENIGENFYKNNFFSDPDFSVSLDEIKSNKKYKRLAELSKESVCKNSGLNNIRVIEGYDLIGNERVIENKIDIGAYEINE